MVLHFEVKIVAEKVFEPHDEPFRFLEISAQNSLRNIARKACRKADKPLVMRFESF